MTFLDSGASSQKPESVIRGVDDYYRLHHANVHRGIHVLAEEATALYEGSRDSGQRFINAATRKEIIYTRNATEAINLVAYSRARANLKAGERILLAQM